MELLPVFRVGQSVGCIVVGATRIMTGTPAAQAKMGHYQSKALCSWTALAPRLRLAGSPVKGRYAFF